MTHFIHTQADLETAVGILIKQDPRWQPVFAKSGMPAIRRREGGYAGLCSIVCGQQVSTASAAAIRARLFAAFEPFHHDTVRLARGDKLARLGLSRPKIKSIKAIGKAISRKHIDLDAVAAMEADQAHAALTALHGIGPWTADIYLLFCLGNADAWPAGRRIRSRSAPSWIATRAASCRCRWTTGASKYLTASSWGSGWITTSSTAISVVSR
jgi:DNA-3-methyladenine glycosylase II